MTEYLPGFCYALFVFSLVVGVGYDALSKRPPAERKSTFELFLSFLLDQLLHFLMLVALIGLAKGVEIFAHLLNGDDWGLFPKNPKIDIGFGQFLRLFDLSCFLVVLHYMVRGLVDVFRGVD